MPQKFGYLYNDFKMFHIKDENQREFDFHYHDFHKILIFLQGDVSYCVEGRNYELKPFDIVLVRAGEVHRPVIHSNSTYERIIIYISDQFLSEYQTDSYDLAQCFQTAARAHSHVLRMAAEQNNRLFACVQQLELSYHEDDYADELNHQILFLSFLIQLNRAAIHHKLAYISTGLYNRKIQEILSFINQNLTSDLSIDTLAGQFFVNRYYLMHTFKAETGYSLKRYITIKRLLLSREMIENGTGVTDCCYQCGFQNYSTFSRAYHKQFGMSPRQSIQTKNAVLSE